MGFLRAFGYVNTPQPTFSCHIMVTTGGVNEGESEGRQLRAQLCLRYPVDGQNADGADQGLDDKQHAHVRPYPVEGHEKKEGRVPVVGQQAGHQPHRVVTYLEPAVLVDGLIEYAQIVSVGLESPVFQRLFQGQDAQAQVLLGYENQVSGGKNARDPLQL